MDDNPYTPEGVSRAFQMEWLKQEIRALKAQLAAMTDIANRAINENTKSVNLAAELLKKLEAQVMLTDKALSVAHKFKDELDKGIEKSTKSDALQVMFG